MTKRIETRKPSRKELRKTLRQAIALGIKLEEQLAQERADHAETRRELQASTPEILRLEDSLEETRTSYETTLDRWAREHEDAEQKLRNERDDEKARAERLAAALRTIGRVKVRRPHPDPASNYPLLKTAFDRAQEIAADALSVVKGT